MKIPNNIKTLTKLSDWCEKNNPKTIEISKSANIKLIREFDNKNYQWSWEWFRGIKLNYLK